MIIRAIQSMWKNERIGLIMVCSSLLIMCLVIGLLLKFQQQTSYKQIRSQGVSLAQLLASMPLTQLVPETGSQHVLQLIRDSSDHSTFAYAVVVDAANQPLTQTAASGVIIPPTHVSKEPVNWLGERELRLQGNGKKILEFYSPLISDGELAGHIRLGFFQPRFGFGIQELPFIATVALLVFLLTPLSYLLIKHEVKPIRSINRQLDGLLSEGIFNTVKIQASGELGVFMQRFNDFFDYAKNRIDELEEQKTGLLTSTKLLSYKRARVEAVLESLPEAIMVLDESENIMYANTKLTSIFDKPLSELIGERINQFCDNGELLTLISLSGSNRIAKAAAEAVEFSPVSSPEKTIRVMAYPLFSPGDEQGTFGTMVAFRDVTQEITVKKSHTEFIAHVSHELKTPLNTLAMYSEQLLGDDVTDKTFRTEAINVIHDEVERITTLVNNLLNLTKFEIGGMTIDKKRTRLLDLLKDVFEIVSRNTRGSDHVFTQNLPKELSAISIDKSLLSIAITNLLTNAIKYSHPDGRITLAAEETDYSIIIRVSDNGIGISDEDKSRIFEKFYRATSEGVISQPGHGLGLPLVKQIVTLHRGKLSVKSMPGEGSEFTIELAKDAGLLAEAV